MCSNCSQELDGPHPTGNDAALICLTPVLYASLLSACVLKSHFQGLKFGDLGILTRVQCMRGCTSKCKEQHRVAGVLLVRWLAAILDVRHCDPPRASCDLHMST